MLMGGVNSVALDCATVVVIVYDVPRGRYGWNVRMRENAATLMSIWIRRYSALGFPIHTEVLSTTQRHQERPVLSIPHESLSCTVSQFLMLCIGFFL